MSNILTDEEKIELLELSYNDFVERLGIEMGNFLARANRGKENKYQGYRSRSASMRLRELLKLYRVVSLRQEKFLNADKKKTSTNTESM
jgi:hypothetical protein